MPIKIFAAPGDHRNDFEQVEKQANEWMTASKPSVRAMDTTVNPMPSARESNHFMMTLTFLYDESGA